MAGQARILTLEEIKAVLKLLETPRDKANISFIGHQRWLAHW